NLGAGRLYADYHSSKTFNQGGYIHCSARAVVENYLLPQRFLPEFSDDKERVDLTKKMWRAGGNGSGYHDNAKDGDKSTAYFIKEQEMSILVDTWALTKDAIESPGETQRRREERKPHASSQKEERRELYERVNTLYANDQSRGYVRMKDAVKDFFDGLGRQGAGAPLLKEEFLPGTRGDDPREPNLSIKPHLAGAEAPSEKIKQASGSSKYFNTEWRDWEQNRNEKTYEKRGPHYLGCRELGSCG
ncbi:MAG TPA: hypothetical protein VLQ93_18280, partial [Myxococcaceae bacterium]|nr:hypothetical protein [Myxococcaceae bacterium]